MKKVEFYLGIGYVGSDYKDILEFEDDTTDEEIEECFKDWADNYIDCGWNVLED